MTGRAAWVAALVMVAVAGCGGGSGSGTAGGTPPSGQTTGSTAGAPPSGPSGSAGALQVTSSAFGAGGTIPERFTCRGDGQAPPLAWSGAGSAPALGLLVDDPDAPGGTYVHWVVLDLPAGTTSLPQGGALPPGTRQAVNSGGSAGWAPPCPPSGTHHYRFTVYALSAPTGLADGAGKEEAIAALDRLAVARGQLVGLVSG